MKKIIIPIIIIVAVILIIIAFRNPVEREAIKIGFVGPLTGDGAIWGNNAKNAMELFLGGKDNIEVIYEDSQCDAGKGVSALRKLIDIDGLKFVIGDICSSVTLAMAPVAEENKVIMISPGSSSPKITEAGDYIFRTWPSDAFVGELVAKYALSQNLKDFAIFTVSNEYGEGLRGVFKETIEQNKGIIKADLQFDQSSKDFRTEITRIKNSNAQALFFVSVPEQVPALLKQMNELNLDIQLLTTEAMIPNEEMIPELGPKAEGIIIAEPHFNIDPVFSEKYEEKYGIAPGVCSPTGYDALAVLIEQIEKVGNNVEAVKLALYSLKDYKGVSGIFSFDENGDVSFEAKMTQIKNGRFSSLQ